MSRQVKDSRLETRQARLKLKPSRRDSLPWGKNHHVRLLKEASKRAKIEPDVSFHELRHAYASLLAQAGADLLTISKLLGHADTRVTSRHYAHLCDKTLSDTVNQILRKKQKNMLFLKLFHKRE